MHACAYELVARAGASADLVVWCFIISVMAAHSPAKKRGSIRRIRQLHTLLTSSLPAAAQQSEQPTFRELFTKVSESGSPPNPPSQPRLPA